MTLAQHERATTNMQRSCGYATTNAATELATEQLSCFSHEVPGGPRSPSGLRPLQATSEDDVDKDEDEEGQEDEEDLEDKEAEEEEDKEDKEE